MNLFKDLSMINTGQAKKKKTRKSNAEDANLSNT